MAVTQFAFGDIGWIAGQGVSVPALLADTVVSEDIEPSGTSQATSAASALARGKQACRISTDTAVYVSFGAAPNAETDPGRLLIQEGATEYVMVDDGIKAAVVTA